MIKFLKPASMLLAASLLFTALASCEVKEENLSTENDTTAESTEFLAADAVIPSAYDYLPDKNYNNENFNITFPTEGTRYLPGQIVTEEETGDIIMDAAYKRNLTVEEKFNIKLHFIPISTNQYYKTLLASIQANDQEYDLACGFTIAMANLATDPIFMNATEIPYIDLSRPWYPEANRGFNVLGKQSIIFSDYTCITLSCTYGLFYNETMGKQYNLPDLQKMVMDGKWTIDRLLEYTSNITADLNGDGKYGLEDRYGHAQYFALTSAVSDTPLAFQYGMGSFTTQLDKNGLPVLSLNTERQLKIMDNLNRLFYEDNRSYLGSEFSEQAIMFANGQALFFTAIIMHAENYMRDMKDDYQILIMPKFDEMQSDYYTTISPGSSFLYAIPVSVKDIEKSGIIFDALSYEGSQTVIPAFFEQSMKIKYSRNEIMPQIFDIVRDSVRVDFGLIYDGSMGMSTLVSKLISKKSTDFSSNYAKLEPKALKQYQKVIDTINSAN